VFAARALKSAIFGTPARPDDTIYEVEQNTGAVTETMASKDLKKPQNGSISPTKPQSILVTPGTASTRRKTVSFGTEVVDKEEKNAAEKTASKEEKNSWASKSASSSNSNRKTSLTRTLENARESKTAKGEPVKNRHLSESQPLLSLDPRAIRKENADIQSNSRGANQFQKGNQALFEEMMTTDGLDGDMTMDLNEPHSQSGKFWKTEYQNYHEQAKTEMDKLVKYKQLATSYAKKKDSEAIELAEKLKEEQRRVLSMEDKVSKLSAKIATTGLDGNRDAPELIKELARQTALAVQYRAQVEEFQAAFEGNEDLANRSQGRRTISPRTEQTLLDSNHEQLKEMMSLRAELSGLRQTLSEVEKTATKLREENTKLTQELLHADLRLEKEIEKSEKRRQSSEEHIRKKDDALQSLQKDYDNIKELAKSSRRDAEHLLKKRHDQVVALKKEIKSLKGVESTNKELQGALEKKDVEHGKVVGVYQKQIARLIENPTIDSEVLHDQKDFKSHDHSKDKAVPLVPITKGLPSNDTSEPNEVLHPRESLIPVSSQSVSRLTKSIAPSKSTRSDNLAFKSRSSHSALSEITNNTSNEKLAFQHSEIVQRTPYNNNNNHSSTSFQEPDMELPSSEPSFSQNIGRSSHERNCQPSPRPSMFNIASSPPKPALFRPRTSDDISRPRDTNGRRQAYIPSSRLSSLEGSRTRSTLPPERAAAAKARLEQKNAEKKRLQALSMDKENIRN